MKALLLLLCFLAWLAVLCALRAILDYCESLNNLKDWEND